MIIAGTEIRTPAAESGAITMLPLIMAEHQMASQDQSSLHAAIRRVAQQIPLDLMMTVGAEEAHRLAQKYWGAGVTEIEILGALVSEVQKRRQSDTR